VRAVVLRVDSPGGLSLASGLMAHGVERIRRETKKPIVVSMAGTAASGGYDLACNADWIFANRFTRTGSIGVVFVKPSLEGLYDKLGVHEDAFRRGAWMDGWSPTTDWDERLQGAADSSVARTYERFVSHVARGRKLEREQVLEVAQGRVWLGEAAKARRLVDAIGGLEDAVAEARRRGGVPAGERIRLAEYGRPRPGLVQRLVGQWLRESVASDLSVASLRGGMLARDDRLGLLPE
jgi:protease-4